jgi:hypothetical protein
MKLRADCVPPSVARRFLSEDRTLHGLLAKLEFQEFDDVV